MDEGLTIKVDRRALLQGGAATALSTSAAFAASTDIVGMDGVALSDAIRTRQVSCVDVMQAYLRQIDSINPKVNAIVALQPREVLLKQAEDSDGMLARGAYQGWLHGMPQAIKDLEPVRGIVSTQGSPIFRNYVPQADSIPVERMRAAGAILVGKTNAPEFGLGSQTYNQVYGTTLNAYDQTRTAGGSSGGAAVAVATRMLPVADGSDYMGSLRNPTAYNNVFGLRPSYGRIPASRNAFIPSMGVNGPVARTVPDLAMLLSVMAGYDPRDPLSVRQDPDVFTRSLKRDFKGTRVAWGGDFKGQIPMESTVLELCRGALRALEDVGCTVEDAVPDYPVADVWRDFVKLRWWQTSAGLAELYADPAKRAQLKPEAIWEVENGLRLSAEDVSRASMGRTAWYQSFRKLLDTYEFFILPSAALFPFDAATHWPREVAGHSMDTYHRWMEIVAPITMTGCPALAAPAGFNGQGLPMGFQIVGRNQAELSCLQLAFAYDQVTGWTRRTPPLLHAI